MLDAHLIAQGIASCEFSSREVVAACIERIVMSHAAINAVVVPRFEQALKEADLADAARSRGATLGPLHGVPITIKESFDLTGTPTTAGLSHRADHRAETDAVVVARLRKAGAIVLGKTNVSQLLLHDCCVNPLYGRTNNPWQLDRSPGASSGGEAAILAVGGSALGIGSDIGGSVRLPAHSCGVNSLKPTSGRLTLEGHISAFPTQESLMCQPGPLARCVTDLTLAMHVLTAEGPRPIRSLDSASLLGLRIGFYTDNGVIRPSPAIRRAVTAAACALGAQGFIVQEWQPPNVDLMWWLYLALLLTGGLTKARHLSRGSKLSWNIHQALLAGILPNASFRIAGSILRVARQSRMAVGMRYCAEQYDHLLERRVQVCRDFMNAMNVARVDAILCPVFPMPALRQRVSPFIEKGLSYAAIYNLLGVPAGVVAATRVGSAEESDRVSSFSLTNRAARQVEAGSAGLPVGVQVVARPWREDIVLGIMSVLEKHFRGQPGYPFNPPRSRSPIMH
jgi:Asp-tRNA(Asn)/Glu-tRNA(Gln) amidotransferase A subunit family amidase